MKERDEILGKRAVELGLLREADLKSCSKTVAELLALGVEKSLSGVLREHGFLTVEQIQKICDEADLPEETPDLPAPDLDPSDPDLERPDLDELPPEPEAHAPEPEAHAPEPEAHAPEPEPTAPEPVAPAPEPEAPAPEPEAPRGDIESPVEEPAPFGPMSLSVKQQEDPSDGTMDFDEVELEAVIEDYSGRSATLDIDPEELAASIVDQTPVPDAPAAPDSDSPAEAKREEDLTGQTLGGCQLEEVLGQGAMGTVYRATHLALRKTVAVKVLLSSRFNEQKQVEQFFTEARAAAAIEHQNITAVHDVGQDEGHYYIVMQFIEGESLQDLIEREKSLEIKDAVRIALETTRGLAVAHKKGVVHRDIKPANIMLTEDGEVKIADFGLAIQPETDDALTGGVDIMGTPAYMSPEQIDGRVVDHRADLYSLGVTLYYLTTGKKPFEAQTPMEVLLKHMRERLVPPTQVNFAIPKELGQVIERLMAKEPSNRYPDAEELEKDLEQILRGGKPKVVVAMEDFMQRMEAIGKEDSTPVRDRSTITAAAVAGVVASVCAILFTVALPDIRAATTQAVEVRDSIVKEAENLFLAADEFARQNPGEIDEIRNAFGKLLDSEYPDSWQTRARTRLSQHEREYDLLSRRKVREYWDRSAKLRQSGEIVDALLTLHEIPENWLAGSIGKEVELKRRRLSLELMQETGMTLVPGGSFLAGREKREEYLPDFLVDVTEVSNRSYAEFVAATKHEPPKHWPGGKVPAGHADLPVVGVTIQDARRYAAWVGKRLPTTLEWEKAARGTDGRTYPWGDEFDPKAANCLGLREGLQPVNLGLTGRSPYGCLHMAGNAFEWTRSEDPDTSLPVVRGGGSRSHLVNVRTYSELPVDPSHVDPARPVGFRCVRDLR
ncbi:MAG: bifunctional serine/threonine-protein kinase/formylglycine-generating enzyme family protein [Planctomycetota bacterium]